MDEKIIVYGHPACPMVFPVKNLLDQSKVDYLYIDIHQDTQAAQKVREINQGYESVPTLVFPDGTTLTEPMTAEVKDKLEQFGYRVPLIAQIIGNLPLIIMGAIVLLTLIRLLGVI